MQKAGHFRSKSNFFRKKLLVSRPDMYLFIVFHFINPNLIRFMKTKIVLGAALLLCFCSCKKERMCECISQNSYAYVDASGVSYNESPAPVKSVHSYSSARQRDIANQCGNSSSISQNSTTEQGTTTSSTYTTITTCEIK